jgi:hypothetical protein
MSKKVLHRGRPRIEELETVGQHVQQVLQEDADDTREFNEEMALFDDDIGFEDLVALED